MTNRPPSGTIVFQRAVTSHAVLSDGVMLGALVQQWLAGIIRCCESEGVEPTGVLRPLSELEVAQLDWATLPPPGMGNMGLVLELETANK